MTTSGAYVRARNNHWKMGDGICDWDTLDEVNETDPSSSCRRRSMRHWGRRHRERSTITDNHAAPLRSASTTSSSRKGKRRGPRNIYGDAVFAERKTASVNYSTSNGTATTGAGDYVATSGSLGHTRRVRPPVRSDRCTVNGDVLDENDETFNLNLSGASAPRSPTLRAWPRLPTRILRRPCSY